MRCEGTLDYCLFFLIGNRHKLVFFYVWGSGKKLCLFVFLFLSFRVRGSDNLFIFRNEGRSERGLGVPLYENRLDNGS